MIPTGIGGKLSVVPIALVKQAITTLHTMTVIKVVNLSDLDCFSIEMNTTVNKELVICVFFEYEESFRILVSHPEINYYIFTAIRGKDVKGSFSGPFNSQQSVTHYSTKMSLATVRGFVASVRTPSSKTASSKVTVSVARIFLPRHISTRT